MLRHRLISAAIALPLFLATVWVGGLIFALVVALTAVGGVLELYDMAARKGGGPVRFLGGVFALLLTLDAYFDGAFPGLLLAAAVMAAFPVLLRRPSLENTIADLGTTMVGIIYCGWMPSHFVLLREMELGREWVLLALLSTFAVDSGAYLVGRWLGKHKLAPRISPGKTWEGAIAGLVAGLAILVFLTRLLALPLDWGQAVALGLAVSTSGQLGDLAESAIKRSAGVKDSGIFLPGHGGILDRADSLIFNGVVVYYFVRWVVV